MIKPLVKYTILISVIFISLMMIYSSMLKLTGFPGMEESFLAWGYSKFFMYSIGIIEMILGIITFFPKLRQYGLLGVMLLMSGAIYTHWTNYEIDQISTAIFMFFLSLSVIILHKFEAKLIR